MPSDAIHHSAGQTSPRTRLSSALGSAAGRSWLSGVVSLWLVGAYLRVWQLGQQPIMGDEMHTFKSAALGTFRTIIEERGFPDVSIPLALWDYLLINTVGLSEWGLRLPILMSGLLFLPLLTWFVCRRLGPWEALTVTAFASLSPILIHFSRFARPYMPTVFITSLAMVFWLRYLDGRRRSAIPALLTTIAAGALSSTCLPALAGLLAATLILGARRSSHASWRSHLTAAWSKNRMATICIVSLGALILTFCVYRVYGVVSVNFAQQSLGFGGGKPIAWPLVGHQIMGTESLPLLIWLAITALVGGIACWRCDRDFTIVILAMTLCQLIGISILVPWSGKTFTITRYSLVLLPGLLAWLSRGVMLQSDLIARSVGRVVPIGMVRLIAVCLTAGGITMTGSLGTTFKSHNSFTSLWPATFKPVFVHPETCKAAWPRFYDCLTGLPDHVSVMEAPCISNSREALSRYARTQALHRKRVLILSRRGPFRNPMVRMQSTITPKRTGILNLGDAEILVVHLDLEGERLHEQMLKMGAGRKHAVETRPGNAQQKQVVGVPARAAADARLNEHAQNVIEFCKQDPTLVKAYEDRWIQVYARDSNILERITMWQATHD